MREFQTILIGGRPLTNGFWSTATVGGRRVVKPFRGSGIPLTFERAARNANRWNRDWAGRTGPFYKF